MIGASIGFIFGTILGSLALCLADRSLKEESFTGRSYCETCKKSLKWYDLFPVFSFIYNRGHCRNCHKKLSFWYPSVEILTGILVAIAFYLTLPLNFLTLDYFQMAMVLSDLAFQCFAITVLVIVLITDIKQGIIPDRITFPSAKIAIAYLFLMTIIKVGFFYYTLDKSEVGKYLLPPYSDYFLRHSYDIAIPLIFSLLSALSLGVFFAGIIILTGGRGMGGGDLKLGVIMGLFLSFPNSLLATILAFMIGSVFGIALILAGKKNFGQTIPFGPFLTIGSIIALFWGSKIIEYYLNFNLVLY